MLCYRLLLCCCDKHRGPKAAWGGEVYYRGKPGQELKQRPPAQGLPTEGWALPQQSLIKEILGRHAKKLTWWGWFLTWGFLFPDDSSLCQVDRLRNTEAVFTHWSMKWAREGEGSPDTVHGGEGSLDTVHERWYQLSQADDSVLSRAAWSCIPRLGLAFCLTLCLDFLQG